MTPRDKILYDHIDIAMCYIEDISSGVDENADPCNTSPENMDAHVCGLAWQELNKALELLAEEPPCSPPQ